MPSAEVFLFNFLLDDSIKWHKKWTILILSEDNRNIITSWPQFMCRPSLFWSFYQVTETIICQLGFRVHCLVMHLLWYSWWCVISSFDFAGQALIWWPARVNKHAWLHIVLGCLSQALGTHDMTWHLGLASAPWPGYLLCPLSHLLLGTRCIGIEAGAITIVAWLGCQPCWKIDC